MDNGINRISFTCTNPLDSSSTKTVTSDNENDSVSGHNLLFGCSNSDIKGDWNG